MSVLNAGKKYTLMNIIKTIIADDHPIFLKGLSDTLSHYKKLPLKILGQFTSGKAVLNVLQMESVDLLILDLNLEDIDGLELIKKIGNKHTSLAILVLSRYEDPKMIKSALQMGAHAYLLKSGEPQELFDAIHAILEQRTFTGKGVRLNASRNGNAPKSFEDKFIKKYYLTKREIQILRLITQAKSNKEIAQELFISDQTVGVHRKNIMRKIGVSNTAGLIKTAYDYCLV